MTREESKRYFEKYQTDNYDNAYEKSELIKMSEYKEIIDKIYNDFESRVCKNCRYDSCGCSIQDIILNFEDKHGIELTDFSDFGCNKFERKK